MGLLRIRAADVLFSLKQIHAQLLSQPESMTAIWYQIILLGDWGTCV